MLRPVSNFTDCQGGQSIVLGSICFMPVVSFFVWFFGRDLSLPNHLGEAEATRSAISRAMTNKRCVLPATTYRASCAWMRT